MLAAKKKITHNIRKVTIIRCYCEYILENSKLCNDRRDRKYHMENEIKRRDKEKREGLTEKCIKNQKRRNLWPEWHCDDRKTKIKDNGFILFATKHTDVSIREASRKNDKINTNTKLSPNLINPQNSHSPTTTESLSRFSSWLDHIKHVETCYFEKSCKVNYYYNYPLKKNTQSWFTVTVSSFV